MRSRDCRSFRPARPVGRLQRAVAQVLQHLDDERADHRLVLDDQHRLARLGTRRVCASSAGWLLQAAAPR